MVDCEGLSAPAISVVLPTYNRALTFERAIEIVLNQTFRDFELVIIDDGSTDRTDLLLHKCTAATTSGVVDAAPWVWIRNEVLESVRAAEPEVSWA